MEPQGPQEIILWCQTSSVGAPGDTTHWEQLDRWVPLFRGLPHVHLLQHVDQPFGNAYLVPLAVITSC